MLDAVHQVQWENFGHHVYGEHHRIPTEFRNLLSQDPDVREAGREFLLGGGQDFGDIYDTTPHIIPFLIAFLNDDATPDKAALLDHLAAVALQIYNVQHPSVRTMRLYLVTYEAFRNGLPFLIHLSEHETPTIRVATANLLQYLVDDVEFLVPELLQRFRSERNDEVRIALLNGLKTLFGSLDWTRYHLCTQYTSIFNDLIAGVSSPTIQVAVARVAIEFVSRYDRNFAEVFPEISPLLQKEFFERASPLVEWEQRDPETHAENIVKELARIYPTPLLDLLAHPALNPKQAHLVARGLLVNAFRPDRQRHWSYITDWSRHDDGMFYGQYHARKFLPQQDKEILQAIVEADTVWQLPTNMFSYFYDLPDSREELRLLLQQLNA